MWYLGTDPMSMTDERCEPMKILVLNGSPKMIKQAGRQYAKKGEIEASLWSDIPSPMIPKEQYAPIVNGSMGPGK